MHPPQVKEQALALVAAGHNDCEVARRLGIPRRTVLDWRRPTYVAKPRATCWRCWRASKSIRFTDADYAEFLGLYLGDGCLSRSPRTFRLRIALDRKYPRIIEDAAALLQRCFPSNQVDVVTAGLKGNCVNVSVYSQHLPCLLPQHGAGKKHDRAINAEDWQREILRSSPWPFIKACIRTDGCCFINRTGPYEYLSYEFSNMSEGVVALFVEACDRVGVITRANRCKRRGVWRVRINRRDSVALMQEHVGLKAFD